MKEYASWLGLAALGLVLIVAGFEGRFGLLVASIFSPASLKIRDNPVTQATQSAIGAIAS